MQRRKFFLGIMVGTALLGPLGAREPGGYGEGKQDGKDIGLVFEQLKKLAGDWQLAAPPDEASKGKVALRYRLTAGGSAVVETIFPGEEMEMVSVYYRDGDQLVLTHYCCAGNQPRMRAKIGDTKDEVIFEFAGGSNLNPAKDVHVHDGRIRFLDADHLHTEWEHYADGKAAGKYVFDLVRKK